MPVAISLMPVLPKPDASRLAVSLSEASDPRPLQKASGHTRRWALRANGAPGPLPRGRMATRFVLTDALGGCKLLFIRVRRRASSASDVNGGMLVACVRDAREMRCCGALRPDGSCTARLPSHSWRWRRRRTQYLRRACCIPGERAHSTPPVSGRQSALCARECVQAGPGCFVPPGHVRGHMVALSDEPIRRFGISGTGSIALAFEVTVGPADARTLPLRRRTVLGAVAPCVLHGVRLPPVRGRVGYRVAVPAPLGGGGAGRGGRARARGRAR